HRADVGEAVVRLAECAGPHEGRLSGERWQPLLDPVLEPPRAPGHEAVAPGGVLERRIRPADHHTAVFGRAHVAIWPCRLPDDALALPKAELLDRLSDESVGRVE